MGVTDNLLAERETTHGSFADNSRLAQSVKAIWRSSPGWERLSDRQREALDMIAGKAARALSGNGQHQDHWDDIAGYAQLALGVQQVSE